MKMRHFFLENFAELVVILLNCYKDVKFLLNVPLFGESWVGNVGLKSVGKKNKFSDRKTADISMTKE